MTTKTTTLLIALMLVSTACGGGNAITTSETQQPSGLDVGSTASTDAPRPTEATSDPGTSVTPALGVSVSAADSFDADHLIDGRGSNFVSMDNPVMVPAAEVTWISDDTIVMGLAHSSGESHAYPVGQMAYHHIANTTIAGEPFLVTY